MTTIHTIRFKIERQLIRAFAMLDAWFDKETDYGADFQLNALLEHTMQGNRSLLAKLAGGSRNTVEITAEELEKEISRFECWQALDSTVSRRADVLGMQAKPGAWPMHGLRRELRNQLKECLYQLDLLSRGEGALHGTATAVHSLLELDVYQYIYCIALLTRRSAGQLEANAGEQESNT
jgi:hypothetical protein